MTAAPTVLPAPHAAPLQVLRVTASRAPEGDVHTIALDLGDGVTVLTSEGSPRTLAEQAAAVIEAHLSGGLAAGDLVVRVAS